MKDQNNYSISNFWFGFMFGTSCAVGLAYLFGTKQGRDSVKHFLRFSENIEENMAKMIDKMDRQTKKGTKNTSPFTLESIGSILQKIKTVTNK